MSDYSTNHISATLPPQKLAFSKKGDKWKEQCVESISMMGNSRMANGRTTWERKQTNYDLVNSITNPNDFKYVLDPYGLGSKNKGSQAQMRDINLIVNKMNRLKGEEMDRPFNYHVMATGGNAVTAKDEQELDMLLFVSQSKLAEQLGIPQEELINPDTGEAEPPKTFPQVEKWKNADMKDIRERWGSDILTYLKHEQSLPSKFNAGWEHGLTVAEEYYYVGISNNQPIVRTCNPLNCEFDRNPDNPNIEDGDWFREDRSMTVGQILDEYGEYMTDAQIKKLDQGDLRQSLSNQMFPEFAYTQHDMNKYERNGSTGGGTRSNSTHHIVSHVVWKSMKKVGFVTFVDENDEEEEILVDEQFKLTPEMEAAGYELEWTWIPEVWHGTKIAESFYVNIEPMPNASRSMDNPRQVKLPYIGKVYNCTNTIQTSLVDLLKPHQYLYNIVWYRLETELAKAKGKKMVMDIAQIPRSEGIDLDKWMYFFENVGLAFVNSFEEGKEKFQGKTSQFNQFSNIDMGLSQAVGQYITILSKIESLMDRIVGIGPEREGDIKASQTATGVQTSVEQSSYITEPWFYVHNEIKTNVLSALLETAKFAYPGQKKLHFITDDVLRISTTVDMDKFSDSDYGVFVTNSSRETKIFAKLEQLADRAMASGTAVFSDVIKMFKSNSISELSMLIEESETKQQARDSELKQMEQKMQQDSLRAAAEEKDKERAFQQEENRLDRENDIRKAVISSMGFDEDIQGNEVNDMVAYGNLALSELEAERRNNLENRKLSQETSEKAKDRQLKEKEIASKERIEKLKAKTALKNKVPGEK